MPDPDDNGSLDNLRDSPLSPQSQNLHRNLLAVSSLAILIGWLNTRPEHFSTLGIDLRSDDQQHALKLALLIVVVYFTTAFVASAVPDFAAWSSVRKAAAENRRSLQEAVGEIRRQLPRAQRSAAADASGLTQAGPNLQKLVDRELHAGRLATLYAVFLSAGLARAILDFLVPIVVAALAIGLLVYRLW